MLYDGTLTSVRLIVVKPRFEESLTRDCFWHGYCHERHCRS